MANSQFEKGYILQSRSLLYSRVFQNEKWLKVWTWCLLKANHKETHVPVRTGRGNTVVKVGRGQFIFGRKLASNDLQMPPSTVRNIVYKFATGGKLDIKEDSHYSIITIINYNEYQNPENYKRTGKKTTKRQPKDTYNNDKNDKEDIYISSFHEQFWAAYPRKVGKQDAIKAWLQLFLVNGKNPSEYYAGELTKEILNEITTALQLQNEHTFSKKDKKYIPYPASWLRGHRWEDELDDNLKENDWVNNYD